MKFDIDANPGVARSQYDMLLITAEHGLSVVVELDGEAAGDVAAIVMSGPEVVPEIVAMPLPTSNEPCWRQENIES